MASNPNPLSQALRQLRRDAGLSGMEAARRAGLSQSKISRAETGAFLPSPTQVQALCRVYDAPAEVGRELVQMARDLAESSTAARVVLQRGGWHMQRRIARLEQAASTVRTFTPGVVIGLLQTRAYVQALYGEALSDQDRDRTVQARLDRQRILDSDREFHFVMSEGALRWNMGGATVMVEQLAALVEATRRPNVHLGVIPWTTPVRVPALHGFTIYDGTAVLLCTQSATAIITDRGNVADYQAYWDELQPLASYAERARAVLERIADDYRTIV